MFGRLFAIIVVIVEVFVGSLAPFRSFLVARNPDRVSKDPPYSSTDTGRTPEPVEKADYTTYLSGALNYLYTAALSGSGGDWSMIALCVGGNNDGTLRSNYLSSLTSSVVEKLSGEPRTPATALDKNKATENARVILTLLALGADPTNVGGYDLTAALCDTDWVCRGTLNNPIFALIALDACGYAHAAEKDALVDKILSRQLADGGWALSGMKADPDVTAMALQSLVAHRSRSDVNSAAQRAISALSSLQLDLGEYRSWGVVNSESASQVIIALCAWGIDPSADSRFIKNGTSVLEGLLGYASRDGGFMNTKPSSSSEAVKTDLMATQQAALALCAYKRFLSGGGSVYKFR